MTHSLAKYPQYRDLPPEPIQTPLPKLEYYRYFGLSIQSPCLCFPIRGSHLATGDGDGFVEECPFLPSSK